VKLVKRDAVLASPPSLPSPHRGRVGEGETGITRFIILGGAFAMPVRRFFYQVIITRSLDDFYNFNKAEKNHRV